MVAMIVPSYHCLSMVAMIVPSYHCLSIIAMIVSSYHCLSMIVPSYHCLSMVAMIVTSSPYGCHDCAFLPLSQYGCHDCVTLPLSVCGNHDCALSPLPWHGFHYISYGFHVYARACAVMNLRDGVLKQTTTNTNTAIPYTCYHHWTCTKKPIPNRRNQMASGNKSNDFPHILLSTLYIFLGVVKQHAITWASVGANIYVVT